jgi:hypothetical protein
MKWPVVPVVWASALLSSLALSAGSAAADPGQPSFDQVLASPDDSTLNVKYAEEQAKAGHLLEAAAALERILLTEPNRADVRLLYAAVLYRLDDIQNASAQLKLVDTAGLTPLQKAEADRYGRLIEGRARRGVVGVRIGGELAAGFAADSNAGGALLTQVEVLPPVPINKQSGTGGVFSGDVHVSIPVGPGEKAAVIGSLAGYDRETVSGGKDQLRTFDGRLGLSLAETSLTFSAVGVARTYQVLDRHYLDEYGGRGEALWRANTRTNVLVSVEGVQQTYRLPPSAGPMLDADGPRYDVEVDVSHRFCPTQTLLLGAGYEGKDAQSRPYAYKAPFVRGRWDVGLPRGTYFVASAGVEFVQYDQVNPILSTARRHDTRTDARLAYGVPFSAFAPQGATGDWRERLAFEISGSWANRDSTSPVVGYQNWGAEARLIWRFGAKD